MAQIDTFLKLVVEQKCSDLHLRVGEYPTVRFMGDLYPFWFRKISTYDAKRLLYEILTPSQIEKLEREKDLDFAYSIPGLARFRVNIFYQRMGLGAVFRVIPLQIRRFEELGLPSVVARFAHLERGLVLVTGPTGSGKTTTLAALIDEVNSNYSKHIITIEDPIEFVHTPKKSIIFHREVGTHAKSFAHALRSALRESPDVLLVGEMRDLESISLALTAAETGILVFATLHTNSAAETVGRIIDIFPEKEQDHIRTMLSVSLQGVISQELLKTKDGMDRVVALEILTSTYGLSNIIRDGKTYQIDTLIQGADRLETGMVSMDWSLMKLVEEGKIWARDAARRARDKSLFTKYVLEEERLLAITKSI